MAEQIQPQQLQPKQFKQQQDQTDDLGNFVFSFVLKKKFQLLWQKEKII
jgi:hypothetical protein